MYGQKGQAIVHSYLDLMSVVPESGHSIKEKIKDIADDRVKETRLTLLREEREETSYLYQWGWYWYPKKGTPTPLQLVKSHHWHQYAIEALQEAIDENQFR